MSEENKISEELGSKIKTQDVNKKFKIIFVLLCFLLLFYVVYKLVISPMIVSDKVKDEQKEVVKTVNSNKSFTLKEPEEKVFSIPVDDNKDDNKDDNNTAFIGTKKKQPQEIPKTVLTKSMGSMIVKNSNSNPSSGGGGSLQQAVKEEIGERIGGSNDMFVSGVTAFKPTTATKSKYNSNLLLEQGTYIPCVLRQKLISNVGGQISCTISENVLSKNGTVTLIEKGSKVIGMYKNGAVEHGSDQIFVVWQEIRTSNNIVINVNSGSTDELGANGLSGWTDTHFWARFGNAIMLSMIMDVSNSASTQLQKKDTRNYLENTQESSESLAKSTLEQMGDIKPTLYKNQGDKVGIFVARDIDFSTVYKLSN